MCVYIVLPVGISAWILCRAARIIFSNERLENLCLIINFIAEKINKQFSANFDNRIVEDNHHQN